MAWNCELDYSGKGQGLVVSD